MASVKKISVYIAHINDIFQNDKLIIEEVNINLYKTKEELMNYFNKKYSIKDSMLIYNRKILQDLDNIENYLILLNNSEISINSEPSINTNTVNNLFTSIINNLLNNSIPPMNPTPNILPIVSENSDQPINPLSDLLPVVSVNNELIDDDETSDEEDDEEDEPLPGFNVYNLSNLYNSNNFSFMNELEQLKSMGFINIILNKEALIINNGDIDKSVNYILENNY